MKGIKPTNILLLARKDVERIKKEARFVWAIDPDGNTLSFRENVHGRISSLAVIGPTSIIDEEVKGTLQKFDLLEKFILEDELLLMEVGIRRGKPYQRGGDRQKSGYLLRRRKWVYLSEKQYLGISPDLFQFLQYLCQETWAKWKVSEIPFILKKGRKLSFRNHSWADASFPGVRFSLSMEDTRSCADVLWAERNLNSVQKRYLSWVGNALAKLLHTRRSKKWREYAERWISCHPLYFWERAADTIKNPSSRAEFLNGVWGVWDEKYNTNKKRSDDMDKERIEVLLREHSTLNQIERMGGIQVRVKRIKRGNLVFEVFPKAPDNQTAL